MSVNDKSALNVTDKMDQFLAIALALNRSANWPLTEAEEQNGVELSLFLLTHLPPARSAALAFLGHIFSRHVSSFMESLSMSRWDAGSKGGVVGLELIGETLNGLVKPSPGVWCGVVTEWGVGLLKGWCGEWQGGVGGLECPLQEGVTRWLECEGVKVVAGVVTESAIHDAEGVVSQLFVGEMGQGEEWLVAHVGSVLPGVVLKHLLSHALRNFQMSSINEQNLTSVNRILAHLAERHSTQVARSLQQLLSESSTDAALPFLLRLAVSSTPVLNALTCRLEELSHPLQKHLAAIAMQAALWVPKYFSCQSQLESIVIHLVLNTHKSAAITLLRLFVRACVPCPELPASVTRCAASLLQGVISEMCQLTHSRRAARGGVPFLAGLYSSSSGGEPLSFKSWPLLTLLQELNQLSEGETIAAQLRQLVVLISVDQGAPVASAIVVHLLQCPKFVCLSHIPLVRIIVSLCLSRVTTCQCVNHYVNVAISHTLQQAKENITTVISCIGTLLRNDLTSELSTELSSHAISSALTINLSQLTAFLTEPDGRHIVHLIAMLPLPPQELPVSISYSLSHAVVHLLLTSLAESQVSIKLSIVRDCQIVLRQLCSSSLILGVVLRWLVEAVFHPSFAYLFGAKVKPKFKSASNNVLIMANQDLGLWMKNLKSHSSIFHAGVIGPKNRTSSDLHTPLSNNIVKLNIQILVNSISVCTCMQPHLDGASSLALLLVEIISPDVMFNGFPWPEEFIKFTFERDLAVRKTIEEFPVVWSLLQVVTQHKAAPTYCSVLLRALTAALTSFWSTCPNVGTSSCPQALSTTQQLLQVLVTAEFVPRVFVSLAQMVPFLAPHEVVFLLQDVWAYLRDHTPSPDQWAMGNEVVVCNPCYLQRTKRIIQANITQLGFLLPSLLQ